MRFSKWLVLGALILTACSGAAAAAGDGDLQDAKDPTIEAVYAATKVFRLHPETVGKSQVKRTKDIIDFIDQYKQKEQRKAV